MQLDTLIRELKQIRAMLPPETEVRVAVEGHWYEFSDIMFSEIAPMNMADDEIEEPEIYLTLGDQHPYDLPHLLTWDELKEVY